ncbi:hypothetical protein SEUBUCD646_0K01920 [Saccharomyces eubayanus]|uniref:Sir1 ORC-binding domain-containing protein n=2 Tax=Saccharomyces TaxID=4930 RepID=A0A6C1EBK3_SACPS|nr:hypothetical protein GRS66_009047 [Saccharomyces pastorianus]CAI1546687.1 hypothetical protein SEUBUCD650_0K01910 [Saccharomyces eubayanus]CAI1569718.1 hypothetical protein SEUBUCD646_0K01920 [Saccharomyces eubayanus]
MYRINSRFLIIDGWVIDLVKKALINPKESATFQNFISSYHLLDWDDIYDEEFNIYCEDDRNLFEVIDADEYWFQIDPITGSVLKVSKNQLSDLVGLRCHRLSMGHKKTLYIHYHPYEKNMPRTCQMQYMHKDLKQRFYPLCTFKGKKFIEIEGFVIKLSKFIKKPPKLVEQTLFDPSSSNGKEGTLSVNDCYLLRKVFKGRSLLYLKLINSNFLTIKDITLFHLSLKQILVKLKKINDYYVCEKYHGQRTTDQVSIHLAIPIICIDNHTKYIVWENPIFSTRNFDAESVGKQLKSEMRIVDRLFKNDIITLENYILRNEQFSNTQQIDHQSTIDSISSTCICVNGKIVAQKFGSLLNQIIFQGKIQDTSVYLIEEDFIFGRLSKIISNFCLTESMARLQWWQNCIRSEFGITDFDVCHQSCNEIKQIVDKAIEFFLPALITQHQKVFSGHRMYGLTNPELSKRYMIIDKFIVDVFERRVVNPLSDDIFRIMSFRNAKLNMSNGLLDWSSLVFDSIPYPVFSPVLFTSVETEEFELVWNESLQAFLIFDRTTAVDQNLIVRRKGIKLDFKSYGDKYLYQGEAEDLERFKFLPNPKDLTFIDGDKNSEKLRFMWREMERVKSLYQQHKLVEESFRCYLKFMDLKGIFSDTKKHQKENRIDSEA